MNTEKKTEKQAAETTKVETRVLPTEDLDRLAGGGNRLGSVD